MRYLLLSVFVVSLVGILVIPHTFAETDDDTVSFVDPEGKFSIEFPTDGWDIDVYSLRQPEATIKTTDADSTMFSTIRINIWTYIELPYEDFTDKDIFNDITGKNNWYCSKQVYDDPLQPWRGCYKFDVISEETTVTNEGRKLLMADMKYILTDSDYYSIDTVILDGNDKWEISARTTVKDNKQSYKFDEKNLQKIREIIKSFVILKPNIELEPEPEASIPEPEASIPEPEASIPDWIKNNAGWWAEGLIDDSAFLQGIQFLIKEGIMTIPSTETSESTESQEVPAWIKNNASWWAKGQIDDNAFVSGIQYLVKVGIIKVS